MRSDILVASAHTYAAAETFTCATVPVGEVWLLKDLAIYNADAATSSTARMGVSRGGVNFNVLIGAVAAQTVLLSSGRFVVLEAGDSVVLRSANAVELRLLACGARLVV